VDYGQVFNILGLSVGIIGAFMVFINSPQIKNSVIIHSDEEINRLHQVDKRKNKLAKFGMLLVTAAFIFQLIATLI
jgi:hypothetical protein